MLVRRVQDGGFEEAVVFYVHLCDTTCWDATEAVRHGFKSISGRCLNRSDQAGIGVSCARCRAHVGATVELVAMSDISTIPTVFSIILARCPMYWSA